MANERLMEVGHNWLSLNTFLMKAKEEDCLALLEKEKKTKRRLAYVLRIFGRYQTLRYTRERNALIREVAK